MESPASVASRPALQPLRRREGCRATQSDEILSEFRYEEEGAQGVAELGTNFVHDVLSMMPPRSQPHGKLPSIVSRHAPSLRNSRENFLKLFLACHRVSQDFPQSVQCVLFLFP